ncbi:MAG: PorT family protein, partial [Lachnoclostridium sp.]|nr:PorT family protein [Lachnoclostridium sp.]
MSKKILILFTICLVTCSSFAQKMKVKNQPYGDQRLYHFGFTVGVNMQDLLINNTGYTENGETWFAEIPSYTPGFNVGLIADMYMNPYMNLRFTPTMHFGEKSFTFIEQNTQE